MTNAMERLQEILDPIDTEDFELAGQAAEPDTVTEFEKTLGFALPADVRELVLSSAGGLYLGARTERWPAATLGDVGPAWTFSRGLIAFGLGRDVPEWADMRAKLAEIRDEDDGPADFAPLLQVDSDPTVFGCAPDHSLHWWNPVDGGGLTPIEQRTFLDLYASEVTALIQRMADMKARLAQG